MGILHCAAQNNHVGVMNFIFESLENMNINEGEIVSFISFINMEKLLTLFEANKNAYLLQDVHLNIILLSYVCTKYKNLKLKLKRKSLSFLFTSFIIIYLF